MTWTRSRGDRVRSRVESGQLGFLFEVRTLGHAPDIGCDEVQTQTRRDAIERGPHHEHHHIHHLVLRRLLFILRRGHRQFLVNHHQADRNARQQIEFGPTKKWNLERQGHQSIGRSQVFKPQERFHSQFDGTAECAIESDENRQLQEDGQATSKHHLGLFCHQFLRSLQVFFGILAVTRFQFFLSSLNFGLQFLHFRCVNCLMLGKRDQARPDQDGQADNCDAIAESHRMEDVQNPDHSTADGIEPAIVQNRRRKHLLQQLLAFRACKQGEMVFHLIVGRDCDVT